MTSELRKNEPAGRYELLLDGEVGALADFHVDGDRVVFPHTETIAGAPRSWASPPRSSGSPSTTSARAVARSCRPAGSSPSSSTTTRSTPTSSPIARTPPSIADRAAADHAGMSDFAKTSAAGTPYRGAHGTSTFCPRHRRRRHGGLPRLLPSPRHRPPRRRRRRTARRGRAPRRLPADVGHRSDTIRSFDPSWTPAAGGGHAMALAFALRQRRRGRRAPRRTGRRRPSAATLRHGTRSGVSATPACSTPTGTRSTSSPRSTQCRERLTSRQAESGHRRPRERRHVVGEVRLVGVTAARGDLRQRRSPTRQIDGTAQPEDPRQQLRAVPERIMRAAQQLARAEADRRRRSSRPARRHGRGGRPPPRHGRRGCIAAPPRRRSPRARREGRPPRSGVPPAGRPPQIARARQRGTRSSRIASAGTPSTAGAVPGGKRIPAATLPVRALRLEGARCRARRRPALSPYHIRSMQPSGRMRADEPSEAARPEHRPGEPRRAFDEHTQRLARIAVGEAKLTG